MEWKGDKVVECELSDRPLETDAHCCKAPVCRHVTNTNNKIILQR